MFSILNFELWLFHRFIPFRLGYDETVRNISKECCISRHHFGCESVWFRKKMFDHFNQFVKCDLLWGIPRLWGQQIYRLCTLRVYNHCIYRHHNMFYGHDCSNSKYVQIHRKKSDNFSRSMWEIRWKWYAKLIGKNKNLNSPSKLNVVSVCSFQNLKWR